MSDAQLKWTLPEFEKLIELGILTEADRVELIGGELIPMAAKGVKHENVRGALQSWLTMAWPALAHGADLQFYSELGWRPDGASYFEPDFLVCSRRLAAATVQPEDVRLVIEVSRTSLAFDLGFKASIYAGIGVVEYWVVDAARLQVHVHREPVKGQYPIIKKYGRNARIAAGFVPELFLRLTDAVRT